MPSSVQRKLAAIMFTDIADFTAISAMDETKALSLLDKQKDVLTPIIQEFNGTLHKEIGDGLLFTFLTVTEAVKCGIKIQDVLKSVDSLNLRIGIHEGEITLRGGDALGDDVNIASRIEPFAPIGGIAISGKVQQNISSLPEYQTEFVGTPSLKGVSQDVKVYCITSHRLPLPDKSKIAAKLEEPAKPRFNLFALTGAVLTVIGIGFWIVVGVSDLSFADDDKPTSIGILMMENLGGEEEDRWVYGLTEDLIISLGSTGKFILPPLRDIISNETKTVIEQGRDLKVEYVLSSSLQRIKDHFKLKCQLIKIKNGRNIFADSFSQSLDSTQYIVSILTDKILDKLNITPILSPQKTITQNFKAFDLYIKGKSQLANANTDEDVLLALEYFKEAYLLDNNIIDEFERNRMLNNDLRIISEWELENYSELEIETLTCDIPPKEIQDTSLFENVINDKIFDLNLSGSTDFTYHINSNGIIDRFYFKPINAAFIQDSDTVWTPAVSDPTSTLYIYSSILFEYLKKKWVPCIENGKNEGVWESEMWIFSESQN